MLIKIWFSIFVLVVLFCQYLEYKGLTSDSPRHLEDVNFFVFITAIFGPWIAIYQSSEYFSGPVYDFVYSVLPQDGRHIMEFTAIVISLVVYLIVSYSFVVLLAAIDFIKCMKGVKLR